MRAATFAVRTSGESMRDRGLLPGDIAVIDRSCSLVSGCIVLGLVGGEFTIKTYRLEARGGLVLEAANPDLPDIAKTSAFEAWASSPASSACSDRSRRRGRAPAASLYLDGHDEDR